MNIKTRFILVLSLLLVVLGTNVFASNFNEAEFIVESTNSLVESMISSVEKTAEKITANYEKLLAKTNGNELALAFIEKNYNNSIYYLGTALAESALRVTMAAIDRIEELGYRAVCYYIPVQLGNQTFYIDPLRLIDD